MDLDGTFIKADMLYESFILAVKKNPMVVVFCFAWVVRGIAFLKYKLSLLADVNIALLPLNQGFYHFLVEQKKNGRRIILATASSEKYAREICRLYPLFDSYICSDSQDNLKGKAKLRKILSEAETFSYAGNSTDDLVLFQKAEEKYLVSPTKQLQKKARAISSTATFDYNAPGLAVWLYQIRVYQWVKNLLLLVPLLVSGSFLDLKRVSLTFLGFISISFLASATYILNDLFDLESDRVHARKKHRPLASGKIGIVNALCVAAFFSLFSLVLAFFLGREFLFVLLGYLLFTSLYSFKVKEYAGLDVISLSILYIIRIVAGLAIIDVTISFWLFSFSLFIFISLALIKRCAELKIVENNGRTRLQGRDYFTTDYPLLMAFGVSSAMLSVLLFCFYINNNVLINQYQEPALLWLIVPLLCYWIMRMWIKTHRGEMHDDPVVFTLKDRGGAVIILCIGIIAVLAQVL